MHTNILTALHLAYFLSVTSGFRFTATRNATLKNGGLEKVGLKLVGVKNEFMSHKMAHIP